MSGRRLTTPVMTITESEYMKFCEYFYRCTGMSFGDNKRYFVDKRVIERIQKTGAGSFEVYFERLRRRQDGPEMEQLINLCTVNETYFYREVDQFECLAKSIMPEIAAKRRKGDRIRIWTLPCSTGEEPYSIALYLLENWQQVDDYDVEITASDIDTNVIRAAEAGLYEARSLQHLSADMISRYFVSEGQKGFRLIESIRNSVSFTQVNASIKSEMRRYTNIDVIFCRNMLIYFDDISRRQVAESIYDCLTPGGFICLGHAESMSRISPLFSIRKFSQAIVYQKDPGAR